MDKYKKTFKTWNKVASLYEDKFMDLVLYNDSYDTFCQLIKNENSKILEIGCGPGNITKYLLTERPDFDLLGIDIAPKMIELAQKNNPKAEFKIMDSRRLPTSQNQFDGIMCGFTLPYLSDKDRLKLIKDCHHLLAPKGIFYLSFVPGNYSDSGFQTGKNGDKMYFYYHELEKVKQGLTANNFQVHKILEYQYAKDNGMETHSVIISIAK